MKKFTLTYLAIFSCLFFNCGFAKKKKKIKIPETKGWVYGDQVFSDSDVNNIDVVELDNGDFRAYYMDSGNIYSALSSDNGLTYTFEDGVRVAGQHHAALKLDDGRIRLYYSTADNGDMISAISDDGLNFTIEDGVRLELGAAGEADSGAIIHPDIIKISDNGYRLFYDALNGDGEFPEDHKGIMSASSTDGLTFTKDSGFRVKAGKNSTTLVWSPFIEFEDDIYKLYFSAEANKKSKQGAYVAVSKDGLKFSMSKKPILKVDKRLGPNVSGPGGVVGLPQDLFIISVENGKRMYYWSAGDHGIYNAFNDLE